MLSKLSSSCRPGKPWPLLPLFRFSTKNPSPKPHFMVEYLVSNYGFSSGKAADACKSLTSIKSVQQPDSVSDFLRTHGFAEPEIRKLVTGSPRCLSLDVDKALAPKFHSLQTLGFSGPDLTQLILTNPCLLHLSTQRSILPKIEFWRGLFGSTDLLLSVLKRNQSVLGYNVEKKVLPNLSLLQEYGVSDRRRVMIIQMRPGIVLQRTDSLRTLAEQVERMGIPRSSGMFIWALWALYSLSSKKFKARSELMRSYGWSEVEFLSAFRKAPSFVLSPEKLIRNKMDFLMKEAGCEPSYLAFYPGLLLYSLDKRMIPRHQVLQVLKSRELHTGYSVASVMILSEKKFMQIFVLGHREQVPELYEMYVSGCKK